MLFAALTLYYAVLQKVARKFLKARKGATTSHLTPKVNTLTVASPRSTGLA